MKCGLLGRKLGHSYSPQIHSFLGDYSYLLFEKEPEEIGDFLKNGDFTGINVTIPYKKDVIPYLDALSPVAARLGAVNTIIRRSDGSLFGHNTDYFGFSTMVQRSNLNVSGQKVLILGSGGASNTAAAVLEELGAEVVVISRRGENHYGNIGLHSDAYLIVNTTPVGMYPETEKSPLDISLFPQLKGVLDVIYNPARTALLQQAEQRGIVAMNGLLMLVAQAKEAAEYFTGNTIDNAIIDKIYQILSGQMQNIVLIGMPGCGKSTIGALLSQRLYRPFADADRLITELAGKPIPEIFSQDGEIVFRDWEIKATSMLGKQSGMVIATGGGCVTKAVNYPLLHQNGLIFWIQRSSDLLPVSGRPLSQANNLKDMYHIREPMYQRFADYVIENSGSVEDAVDAILSILEERT